MNVQKMFGRDVVPSSSEEGAIGASVQVGVGHVRPPVGIARVALKLAGGAVADLSTSEREHLECLGIEVERVEMNDTERNRIRNEAIAAGQHPDVATIKATAARGGYRSTQPVSLATWFRPS